MFKPYLLPVLILAAGSLLGMAHAAAAAANTLSPADPDGYGRLRLMAIRACLPLPQKPVIYADWERCYNVMLQSAVRQARSPQQSLRAPPLRG